MAGRASGNVRKVWFLLRGKVSAMNVRLEDDADISDMKRAVHEEYRETLRGAGVDAGDLLIFKSRTAFDNHDSGDPENQALKPGTKLSAIDGGHDDDHPLYVDYSDEPAAKRHRTGEPDEVAVLRADIVELIKKTDEQKQVADEQKQIMHEFVQHLRAGARLMARVIHIQSPIPPQFVGKSIGASNIGSSPASEEFTNFATLRVIRHVRDQWHVELPAAAHPSQPRSLKELADVVDKSEFGFMNVENDNEFNTRVSIQDPDGKSMTVSSRVDALLLGGKHYARRPLVASADQLLHFTLLFVEVESSGKGLEFAETQLLLSMMAICCRIGREPLYGVAISADFTKARLVKYHLGGCLSDGIFHPTQICDVAALVVKQP